MKNVDDALSELVNEFAALPALAAAKNPLTLVNFCDDLENGVIALDAITLGIGHGDADPRGQAAALGIVSERLLFNVRALRLLLMSQAGRA